MNKWGAMLCLFIAAFTCGSAFAQTETFFTETGVSTTVIQCDGLIYDGGGATNPYSDVEGAGYTDVLTVCPQIPSTQSIKINFQAFDIAIGDTLTAYDGEDVSAPLFTTDSPTAGSGTGASVADAPGGGWIAASCENMTGCVTLKFMRNGDHIYGAGFRAAVECMPRENTYLDCSRVGEFNGAGQRVVVADCGTGTAKVDIPIPAYYMCDLPGKFTVSSSCAVGLPDVVDGTGTGFISGNFPIGSHTVVFSGRPFGDQQCVAHINVLAPPLACNDNLNVSLSGQCVVTITPDLILDNICEPDFIVRPIDGALVPAFFYEISINDLGSAQVIGTTVEGYPLVDFSAVECGAQFSVNARRNYIVDADCDGSLFNGYDYDDPLLIDECWGSLIVEDKIDPIILNGPPALAIPCYENTGILETLNEIAPEGSGLGGELFLPTLNITLNVAGSTSLSTEENCGLEFSSSAWQEVPQDCSVEQLVTDWNGFTYEAPVFTLYTRQLSIADRCGNSASYTQEIFVLQPDFVAPIPEIDLPCGFDIDPHSIRAAWVAWVNDGRPANDPRAQYASYLPNFDNTFLTVIGGNPIDNSDYEVSDSSGDEIAIEFEHAECGYAISWIDGDKIPACGGGYKVFREWTVYNWCDGMIEFSGSLPQVIKVADLNPPVILDSIPYTISDNIGADCTGSVTFYPPNISDACSNITTFIQIGTDTRVFTETGATFSDFSIGEEVVIKITATDACGNSSNRQDTVLLLDIVPPTPICEQIRTVSLNNDCEVFVPAESFDDGSYDNCGGISFLVARMDSDSDGDGFPEDEDYGDGAIFSAADLEDSCGGTTMVVFKVTDTNGNSNICMVEVQLQDKIPPTVEDVYGEVTCDGVLIDELIALANAEEASERAAQIITLLDGEQIGTLVGRDNCSDDVSDLRMEILNTDFSGFDATCRNGVMTYFFQVYDQCNNQSAIKKGTILVRESSDWIVNFPMDAEIFCDDPSDAFATSTLSDMMVNNGCDNWGLEVSEEIFETSEDACSKRVYTYKFINWCTWSPSNSETAIVERPDALITNPLHTVALRFRDVYQNDPATGELLQDQFGQFIPGADGVNDIDDGNEDFDFDNEAVGIALVPEYIYRPYDANANGSTSYQETREALAPIELPLSVFDGQRGVIRLEDEILNDADEATDFDVYDVTNAPFDGDFVVVDNFDLTNQNIPVYNLTSQFSNAVQTYVSAQAYGSFAYRQIVKVYDVGAPSIDVIQDGPFCGGDVAPAEGDVCSAPVEVRFLVDDTCSDKADLNVTYQLRAFGGSPIIDPFGQIVYQGDGLYRISGTYPMLNGGLTATHSFVVTVTDDCGNTEQTVIPFEVRDCKEPTAYCLFGLSTSMDDNGEVELWASDFDAGSNDNCTAIEDIRLTFADPNLYPDSVGRTFRCADGEVGTVQVYLWAQDLAGNASFCETFITIQASDGCSGAGGAMAAISGSIMTTQDEPLESVEMTLSGDSGEMAEMMGDGEYAFPNVELGYDYTITPYKNDGVLNGVSTFDLVLMNRHILSTRPLTNPYQLIAADVNNSGNVSTFDIVLLRKLILNIDDEFSRNTSWKFIPRSFEFPEANNPWATEFPEIINVNNFSQEVIDADFVAVKVGDVNGNASATSNFSTIEGRSQWSNKELQVRNRMTETGYQLDFYAPELENLDGFQFSLDFDAARLAFEGFQAGVLDAEHFGFTKADDGLIYVSWNSFGTHEWTAGDKLFSLTFKASNSLDVEKAIDISKLALSAEAYDKQGAFFGLELAWLGGELEDLVLHQNTPNPFKHNTTIAFELPQAGEANIEIRDVSGKLLTHITGDYPQGYNSLVIDTNTLPQAGVFYYSLKTQHHQATKKMILIKQRSVLL